MLWLDASDVDGDNSIDNLVNGSAIASWTDKSNQANQVLQTVPVNRPTYQKSGFGEKAGIHFDGERNFFYLGSSLRSTPGPISAFVLSKRESQGGDPGAYLLGEPSWHLTTPTGSGNSAYPPQTNKFSASSGKTITNLKIGKDGGSSSFDFAGDIAEVLIFDRELSSEEANQVEGYLAHRWGAIDSLLPYHPHKEFPPSFENSPKIKMKEYVNPSRDLVPITLSPLHINNFAP